MDSWMLYPVLFVVTLFLSWLLTPFAGKLAQRWGCVDRPGGRKIHLEEPGASIAGSILERRGG